MCSDFTDVLVLLPLLYLCLFSVPPHTSESDVMQMIEKAKRIQLTDCKEITSMIWLVFSNPEALNRSFLLPKGEEGVLVNKGSGGGNNGRVTVDVAAVHRTYEALLGLDVPSVTNAFENAMSMYCSALTRQKAFCQVEPLNHIVLLLGNPQLHSPDFMTSSGKLLQLVASLPVQQKEMLVRFYSTYSIERLREFVSNFHQLITMQLLFSDDSPKPRGKPYLPQTDPLITSSTTVMMIFFFASLLSSENRGLMRPMNKEMSSIAAIPKPQYLQPIESEFDQLLMRLQVSCVVYVHSIISVDSRTCTRTMYSAHEVRSYT